MKICDEDIELDDFLNLNFYLFFSMKYSRTYTMFLSLNSDFILKYIFFKLLLNMF